jgi:hypothetical protein
MARRAPEVLKGMPSLSLWKIIQAPDDDGGNVQPGAAVGEA